jgi:hypothetical protein
MKTQNTQNQIQNILTQMQFILGMTSPLTLCKDLGDLIFARDTNNVWWSARVTKQGKLKKNSVSASY